MLKSNEQLMRKRIVITNKRNNNKISIEKKSRIVINKVIHDKKCMARTAKGKQCQRKAVKDEDYCNGHNNNNPYGNINDPVTVKKKRVIKKEISEDKMDMSLYMKMDVITLDDVNYLIDENGVLFSDDEKCEIVGIKKEDCIMWCQ